MLTCVSCVAGTMPVAYEWLMPLAPWEPAQRLQKALESLYQQTWPARRLIVSVDGQLSDQLEEVFNNAPLPVLILQSPSWQGTGPTLAAGLSACECEWVLRADADDISVSDRAERQLLHLLKYPNLAVLGGQLSESSNKKRAVALRRVPLRPQKIKSMLTWRNPINHPTVALNRHKVLLSGSYREVLGFEDWDLWLRINKQGGTLANLPEVLVRTEVDMDHLGRRHGITYAKREVQFLLRCYRENLMSIWQVAILFLSRLPWRVFPKFWLAGVMGVLRSQTTNDFDQKET